MPADPKPLTNSSVVVRNDDLLATDLTPSETVVLDIEGGTYFGVDNVGRLIWDLLASPQPTSEIIAEVCNRYDVEADQAEADVHEFIDSLITSGLVSIRV